MRFDAPGISRLLDLSRCLVVPVIVAIISIQLAARRLPKTLFPRIGPQGTTALTNGILVDL